MYINSPFDITQEASILKKINVSEITEAYLKEFKIDVSSIFGSLQHIYICQCPKTSFRFYYPFGLDGDSDFYKQLSLNNWYYSTNRWEHAEVIKYINTGDKVLEVGSGDGVFIEKLVAEKAVSYTGLELNRDAIERAKAKNIVLTNELLHQHVSVESNVGKYDVVCSFQVFEHISDINSAFKDSLVALKPGGRLIVAVPNNDAEFIGNNIHVSRFLNMPPHHVNLFGEESLRKLAGIFDLTLEKIIIEPLQDLQIDTYLYNRISRRVFNNKFLLRLIWKLKIHTWFRSGVRKRKDKITGHTIIAVYKKK